MRKTKASPLLCVARWEVVLGLGLAACAGPEPIPRTSSLTEAFGEASRRSAVPIELLAAVGLEQTGLDARPSGLPAGAGTGADHVIPSVGPLGLRPTRTDDQIAIAAAELALEPAEIAADPKLGIFAGAAVLRALANEMGTSPTTIADWAPVLARYSGLPEGAAQRRFVGDVLRDVREGFSVRASNGEQVRVSPREAPEPEGVGVHELALADYAEAEWSPASGENYTSGRGGNSIDFVVIHTTQGSYNGAISWFANPASSASAHYVIRSSDGAVTQMVEEADTGWHAGNWDYNQRSVGIEHEGFVEDPDTWYTDAMYASSARLTRYLADKYGISIDRDHIIGHDEVPDPNNPGQFGGAGHHTDPGGGWDWGYYMDLVQDAGGPPRPDWGAELVAKDHPAEMTSGDRVVAWVDFENTGRQTWGLDSTFIAVTDETVALYDAENWITDRRASGPDHSTYSSGTTGRFTFMITAPDVTEDTTVVQHFAAEQEGVGRIGPTATGDVTFEILVHPRGGGEPEPDPGADPDPGSDPEPGGDPDSPDPDADPMTDPGTSDTDGVGYAGASGCSVSRLGAKPVALLPPAIALVLVAVRRPRPRKQATRGASGPPGRRAR